MKSESGFSFAIASQPFYDFIKNLLYVYLWQMTTWQFLSCPICGEQPELLSALILRNHDHGDLNLTQPTNDVISYLLQDPLLAGIIKCYLLFWNRKSNTPQSISYPLRAAMRIEILKGPSLTLDSTCWLHSLREFADLQLMCNVGQVQQCQTDFRCPALFYSGPIPWYFGFLCQFKRGKKGRLGGAKNVVTLA